MHALNQGTTQHGAILIIFLLNLHHCPWPHRKYFSWDSPSLADSHVHMADDISVEPAVFSGLTVHGPYNLLWAVPFPTQKLPRPLMGSRSLSDTWLSRPTWTHMPSGILIGLAIFAGLIPITYKQTDHATHIRCGLITWYTRSPAVAEGPCEHAVS